MTQGRTVFCKKLQKEAPGLPFKPFPNELGQMIFDHVSLEAWQSWLRESPRFINTGGWDLQSEAGREALTRQMRIFFGFEDGELMPTAWTPPEENS